MNTNTGFIKLTKDGFIFPESAIGNITIVITKIQSQNALKGTKIHFIEKDAVGFTNKFPIIPWIKNPESTCVEFNRGLHIAIRYPSRFTMNSKYNNEVNIFFRQL